MSVPEDTDGLAAEYVLGTLDSDERSQAQQLLAGDDEFATKVKQWERRLGELHLMVEPVEPGAEIWQRIKAKLPEPPAIAEPAPQEEPQPQPVPAVPDAAIAAVEDAAESLKAETKATPSLDWAAFEAEVENQLVPAVTSPATDVSAAMTEPPVAPAPPVAAAPPVTPVPPVPSVPPAPSVPHLPVAPAPAPVVAAPTQPARSDLPIVGDSARIRRRLVVWRTLAGMLTIVVLAFAALLASWRFAPDRLPPGLQPVELMRLAGISLPNSPPRRPAPPESRYDE
jgi:pyruvate/2-oxoglutarate dehydrogenase complex dihydrolipoamide acyltransferase (E2) component